MQPPEAPSAVIELVVIGRMGHGGGQSTKAGNIRLNIGKLLDALATGVLTGIGAAQVPLAALVIWNSLWRTAQVTISEIEAGILYTMWLHKNADRDVSEDGLLEKCNALLEKYDRPMLPKGTPAAANGFQGSPAGVRQSVPRNPASRPTRPPRRARPAF